MSLVYMNGLDSEADHQNAISQLEKGQRVWFVAVPGNAYRGQSLRVVDKRNRTLGYVTPGCWLNRALLDEGQVAIGKIKEIKTVSGDGGHLSLCVSALVQHPDVPINFKLRHTKEFWEL